MVRIRMQRFGRTHRPFYRITAVDIREKRNGKVLENLGWYNPVEKDPEKQISLNTERIRDWIGRGAQPSETVMDILGRNDLLDGKLKAAWEARRESDRRRVACKQALKGCEEIVAGLEKLAADNDGLDGLINTAKKSVTAAKASIANALLEHAEQALEQAKAAQAQADTAMAEAKAKAEAEAAAAAAAEAEAAEGEAGAEAGAEGDTAES